jgi:hypothetical protein
MFLNDGRSDGIDGRSYRRLMQDGKEPSRLASFDWRGPRVAAIRRWMPRKFKNLNDAIPNRLPFELFLHKF